MKYNDLSIGSSLDDVKMKAIIFENLLDETYEGIVIVDKNARVIYMNQAAMEIVNTKDKEIQNQFVNDLIPESRLPIILKTGKTEIGWPQKVGDNHGIVHRVPIILNGEIVGALGSVIFRDIRTIEQTLKKLNLNLSRNNDGNYYSRIGAKYSFDNIIGKSVCIKNVKETARKIAHSTFNVLIIGETGTGKELFAHAIHGESQASSFPFIRINCASIPNTLLESELFGHEKGAFTGALSQKQGKFEIAGHGTILLDEIGEMDLFLQSKLLRVLEEREFERVGGSNMIKLNARVIASTNKDLYQLSKQGKFRLDLYHRLNTLELNIPSLRERKEDILYLYEYFQKQYKIGSLSSKAQQAFLEYDWFGNVRELENIAKKLFVLYKDKEIIQWEDIQDYLRNKKEEAMEDQLPNMVTEKQLIQNALTQAEGNKSKACRLLNISRTSLYNKMKQYHLEE